MATYKLIQDIEAEDHILGPLSFRQFVFALIAVFCFYLCFLVYTKHIAVLLIIFLPPGLFFGFFALPFGRDQPTEVWALAKMRFWFKPRKRIWDQSGMKELVTITVPKKIEHIYTDGLSQNEVKSRLSALANTLDSRGWATRNAVGDSAPTAVVSSDRLVSSGGFPQQVPTIDVRASDDILDTTNSPLAQQFDTMIDVATQERRQRIIDEMNDIRIGQANEQPAQPEPELINTRDWFQPQTQEVTTNNSPLAQQPVALDLATPMAQDESAEEVALVSRLHAQDDAQHASYAHLRTVQPVADPTPLNTAAVQQAQALVNDAQQIQTDQNQKNISTMTATPDPAILNLANNNDLNISTLARAANKAKGGENPDEVVISLH